MTVFGPMFDGGQVEVAVQRFLSRWLPTYLEEVARQADPPIEPGTISKPRSWTTSPEFEIDEATQLPAMLIINAGIAEDSIYRQGDGSYNVSWVIGIASIVSAKDQESTDRLAKRYGAAIRSLMLQHPAMETDNMRVVSWDDEKYDDVPPSGLRTLAGVRMVFTIEAENLTNSHDGPMLTPEPPADPTAPWQDWETLQDAQHVHIDVTRET